MKRIFQASMLSLSALAAVSAMATDELDNAPVNQALVVRTDARGNREVFRARETPRNDSDAARIANAVAPENRVAIQSSDELDHVTPTSASWYYYSYNYSYSYSYYNSGYSYYYQPCYNNYYYGGYSYSYYSYSYHRRGWGW